MGASTATTLRLCRPFAGTGRLLIADSWFGSCNTAEWLWDELGLYCILAVKTGHRGFPKAKLVAELAGNRFSSKFYKIKVQLETGEVTMYAGGFQDKKPMLLVATAGTSLPGETVVRQRREFRDGGVVRTEYECTQPGMHDQYRRHFNAIDLFNRDCFGSHSLQFAVQTRSWYR